MIAVVIPTLNEAPYIGGLLARLLADAPPDLLEVWVADGGSTDGTLEIVAVASAADPRVRLLANPQRLQAAGVNLASRAADPRVSILLRIDAHAGYPTGFIARLARTLETTGADSVVVRLRTLGRACFQKAVAAVSNSALGTGGAAHRVGGDSRWIDHGHHAAFRRARFLELGGYDPDFRANEDAEYDARLRRAGGRIWFAADIVVDYYPRKTPTALARQYFRYGVGRAQNRLKNGERLRARQLVPPLLVIVFAVSSVAAPFAPACLLAPAAYAIAVATAAAGLALRGRDLCLLGAAAALPAMHLGWGAGFLHAIIRGQRSRAARPASSSTEAADASGDGYARVATADARRPKTRST